MNHTTSNYEAHIWQQPIVALVLGYDCEHLMARGFWYHRNESYQWNALGLPYGFYRLQR